MDEQQVIQFLNQIPLAVLQNYVAQRMQQEQSAGEMVSQEAMPVEQQAQPVMARGGHLRYWSPDVDIYSCGGSTRSITRGRLGARTHKR